MKTDNLAILGGEKAVKTPLKRYSAIGQEEIDAALEVVQTGILSKYLGAWHEDFYGGPKVREFEEKAANYFSVKHAVTMNSWTSGLIAAVGAIGIEPGDEVIVTPWTMCASATAILHWNAIPVFADIDEESFNISPKEIEKVITPYTKAIMSVDIFGQSADMDDIMRIASERNLKVISDTAQAPGAMYKGQYAGTFSHVGGFSLNYHKHIHTGEGGIVVTNDDGIAERLQLIRNHAEAVLDHEDKKNSSLVNMIGHNFRLGEIECAIGIQQLKKLKGIVQGRCKRAQALTENLAELPGLIVPRIKADRTHVYYTYGMQLETERLEVSRKTIALALQAEGVPVTSKYQNLHLLPQYQQKIAYGSKGFPWSSAICHREVNYDKGICPVAEKLQDETYMGLGICEYELEPHEIEQISTAFRKVWNNLDHLRSFNETKGS